MSKSINYLDVEPGNIRIKPFKDFLLINYNNDPLKIQSPWEKVSRYGIPAIGKYNPDEKSRQYLKLPISDESFISMLNDVDSYFESDKFKTQYLSEKQQKYTYNRIVKDGEPLSIKLKMKIVNDELATEIYKFTEEGKNEIVECKNMDDVAKAIPFRSEVRVKFQISRLWIQPALKQYGCIVQLIKAQVRPPSKEEEPNDDKDSDDFFD